MQYRVTFWTTNESGTSRHEMIVEADDLEEATRRSWDRLFDEFGLPNMLTRTGVHLTQMVFNAGTMAEVLLDISEIEPL